jgi:hypothetical protein
MRTSEVLCGAKLLRKARMFVAAAFFFVDSIPFSLAVMYSSESLEAPTYWRAVRFWLVSIGLGTLFIVFTLSAGSGQFAPNAFHLYVGAVAALVSLPALLFLLLFMGWAVGEASIGMRWLRLLAVQSISAGLTTALVCAMLQHDTFFRKTSTILEIGAAYYVAGLVAACWLYRRWLRNPTQPALDDQPY